jgi:hypothetical protein
VSGIGARAAPALGTAGTAAGTAWAGGTCAGGTCAGGTRMGGATLGSGLAVVGASASAAIVGAACTLGVCPATVANAARSAARGAPRITIRGLVRADLCMSLSFRLVSRYRPDLVRDITSNARPTTGR